MDMATVQFPRHLTNQLSMLESCEATGRTVAEVVEDLERQHPGVRSYLLDDHGEVRQHVNLFIGDQWLQDRKSLSDPIAESDTLFIMQALSGG
ncbi:unnamed protein product [marine sediment metagenome]|uniref:MoaD/ThiS family protein n=1 Tax=marine sediment metagenome TaxID=412755 RepID=X0VD58_9ZZZZ